MGEIRIHGSCVATYDGQQSACTGDVSEHMTVVATCGHMVHASERSTKMAMSTKTLHVSAQLIAGGTSASTDGALGQ